MDSPYADMCEHGPTPQTNGAASSQGHPMHTSHDDDGGGGEEEEDGDKMCRGAIDREVQLPNGSGMKASHSNGVHQIKSPKVRDPYALNRCLGSAPRPPLYA